MTPLDLQVNGFAGVDFNAPGLTPERLVAACRAYRAAGGGRFLATVITADLGEMEDRIRAVVRCRAADPVAAEVVAGVHVEGPFLNPAPGYIGAHPPEAARLAAPADADRLIDAGEGLVRLVTLAPERDPGLSTTAHVAARGVAVAAGHCDPSFPLLRDAAAAGVTMFTHLGNGCPHVLPRHDNVIHRVLALSDRIVPTFIPDGAHVPFFVLRTWLRMLPPGRFAFVTDATAAAGLGPGVFTLGRRPVRVGPDGVARSEDGTHLVGATLTAGQLLGNARDHLGFDAAAVAEAVAAVPYRLIGLVSRVEGS